MGSNKVDRVSKAAVEALHVAMEEHMVTYMQCANRLTVMCGRVTLMKKDFDNLKALTEKDNIGFLCQNGHYRPDP